jgi:CheY-specific phosphatase CheX
MSAESDSMQLKRLRATHSVNGVRSAAKNILAERTGGRKDHKIDCLAADLIEEFGNWSVAVRE